MYTLQNFLDWINLKFKIHNKINPPSFKEKEVWWCNLGQNISCEENGKGVNFNRPVVVLKKFNKFLALVVPSSTKLKDNPFYILFRYNNSSFSAMISQIRVIYSKRLVSKITTLDKDEFLNISKAIIDYLPKN